MIFPSRICPRLFIFRIISRAWSHGTLTSFNVTFPLTSSPITIFRPLTSAIKRTTFAISASWKSKEIFLPTYFGDQGASLFPTTIFVLSATAFCGDSDAALPILESDEVDSGFSTSSTGAETGSFEDGRAPPKAGAASATGGVPTGTGAGESGAEAETGPFSTLEALDAS